MSATDAPTVIAETPAAQMKQWSDGQVSVARWTGTRFTVIKMYPAEQADRARLMFDTINNAI